MLAASSTPCESVSGRSTDHLDLGVLAACYPRDVIEDVLADTGAKEQRARSLPAHVMVRHAIAHGLDPSQGTDAVLRRLAGSLRTLDWWDRSWKVPSTSAIAQARLLTLSEVGTHAITGVSVGTSGQGERTLAADLAPLAQEQMLVLADAGFYSWGLFDSYAARGGHLLWRVGANVELPPIQALPDGSYTALLFARSLRRPSR